jgi:hypothetical protein
MKNVYLSILDFTVKVFIFHCKKTMTLVLPRCEEVFVVTEAEKFGARVKSAFGVCSLRVLKKNLKSFPQISFFVLRICFPSFLFARILTSADAYCCGGVCFLLPLKNYCGHVSSDIQSYEP